MNTPSHVLPESAPALEVLADLVHHAGRPRVHPQLAHLYGEDGGEVAVDAEVAAPTPDAGGALAHLAAVPLQTCSMRLTSTKSVEFPIRNLNDHPVLTEAAYLAKPRSSFPL